MSLIVGVCSLPVLPPTRLRGKLFLTIAGRCTSCPSDGGILKVDSITAAMSYNVHLKATAVSEPFVTHRACVRKWFCIILI